jgi:hypothetical protein
LPSECGTIVEMAEAPKHIRRWLQFGGRQLLLVALALAGVGCVVMFVRRGVGPGAPIVVPLTVKNPRDKGKHLFVERDARGFISYRTNLRTSPSQEELFEYRVRVAPLCKLESGEITCPIVYMERASFGRLGGVTSSRQREPPFRIYVAGEEEFVPLPPGQQISAYILLLNAFDEDTGWRFFEVPAEQVTRHDPIVVPDLLSLPLLDDVPNHESMWTSYMDAEKDYQARLD